jgi:ATP-binding cassette, subfamily B (MDR/TAP), member 1
MDEATSAIDVRGERIVQAALDQVSKNRTTIVIAHRLSTIKKSDKIVVLSKGKIAEEGTHESLLENPDGIYFKLANAQKILGGDGSEDETPEKASLLSPQISAVKGDEGDSLTRVPGVVDTEYKEVGAIRSIGLLIYEQRHHWLLYTLTILSACGAACKFGQKTYRVPFMIIH